MKTCKGCKHYKKDEDNGLIICEFGYDGWHRCVKDGEDFAIEELEKLKVKVIALSYDCKIATIDRYEVEKLIDRQIAELKGENK